MARRRADADVNLAAVRGMANEALLQSENAFRVMLHAIGIAQRQRNRLVTDGYTSMRTILDLHPHDVDGFKTNLLNLNKHFAASADANLRVYFTPVNISRLIGVVHYFDLAVHSFHKVPDILSIDDDNSASYSSHYRTSLSTNEDEVEISIPVLSGSSNWTDFRDKFLMKLSRIIGSRGFPLLYVVDNTVRTATRAADPLAPIDDYDITDDSIFISWPTHFGTSYKSDNKLVWDILKAQLLGSPAYNHISRFDNSSNGRSAWNTLQSFYEGEDFQERTREAAFAQLTNTFYRGDTNRFTFEKYVNIHKSAHKMLEDCGYNGAAGMDDATKIQHFKSGIKSEAGLESALTQTRANPLYRSFDQLISFLTAEVDHKNVRRTQLNSGGRDRRASAIGADGKKNGRGKNNSKKGSLPSKFVDGLQVFAKTYPKKEFSHMTQSQRSAVIELNRARRKKGQGKDGNGNNHNNDHDGGSHNNISAATLRDLREDMASMGDAIIAGVSRATGEDISVITDSNESSANDTSSKRKATAGHCGEFIRNRRQRNNSSR